LKNNRILSFLLLAFASTWLLAGAGAALGIRTSSGTPYVILAAACMLMPALAAIVQQRLIDRRPWSELGLPIKGMDWKMLGLTALIGAAIVPTAFLVVHVLGNVAGVAEFGHVSITSERMIIQLGEAMAAVGRTFSSATMDALGSIPGWVVVALGLLSAVLAACTLNLPFMLGEELGWRGYLFHATSTWSTSRRVLFTGVVWGLWHAPLILMGHNYPEHPVLGVPLMVVFCTLLAYLFDWTRRRVRAVWGACVLHGIINGSAGLFALFSWGGHSLVRSPTGVAGFIALALLCVVVFVFDRRAAQQSALP
jgi:membrane protease YdiL (CAAX protease family)